MRVIQSKGVERVRQVVRAAGAIQPVKAGSRVVVTSPVGSSVSRSVPSKPGIKASPEPSKYKFVEDGPLLEGASLSLDARKLGALRALGIRTVPRLHELMTIDPRGVGRFLDFTAEGAVTLTTQLASATGYQALTDNERTSLEELPCSLGAVMRPDTTQVTGPTGPLPADAGAVLAAGGVAPDPDSPGFDMVADMPAIRDQGARGTCVAHAVVRCLEFLESQHTGTKTDLSEQLVYWCMKEIDGRATVEGSHLFAGCKVIVDTGACEEGDFPYVGTRYQPEWTDPPQRGERPSAKVLARALVHRALSAREINARDIEALQVQLLLRTPVAFAMPVFRSWHLSPRTRLDGFVTLPIPYDTVTGYHAVTLVGFGIDADLPGGGYFIFDNSWSTAWASKNVFRAGSGILPFKYVQLHGREAWAVMLEEPQTE